MIYTTRRYKDTSLEYQIRKTFVEEIMKEIYQTTTNNSKVLSEGEYNKVEELLQEPAKPTNDLKVLMARGKNNVEYR